VSEFFRLPLSLGQEFSSVVDLSIIYRSLLNFVELPAFQTLICGYLEKFGETLEIQDILEAIFSHDFPTIWALSVNLIPAEQRLPFIEQTFQRNPVYILRFLKSLKILPAAVELIQSFFDSVGPADPELIGLMIESLPSLGIFGFPYFVRIMSEFMGDFGTILVSVVDATLFFRGLPDAEVKDNVWLIEVAQRVAENVPISVGDGDLPLLLAALRLFGQEVGVVPGEMRAGLHELIRELSGCGSAGLFEGVFAYLCRLADHFEGQAIELLSAALNFVNTNGTFPTVGGWVAVIEKIGEFLGSGRVTAAGEALVAALGMAPEAVGHIGVEELIQFFFELLRVRKAV
jgi:hypothetical protein